MIFKNLEDKCLTYRSLTDYKLLPNGYVIVMLDGRSFSKNIKKKFERPFDENFISMMNETAEYLCKNIQGCKMGYVQSDEISLLLSDIEGEMFFGGRLCKILSLTASMATAKFNGLMAKYYKDNCIDDYPMFNFDSKAWNVPTQNDIYAWFLFRQLDCEKNSMQQFAQTYCSHKELLGKTSIEQVDYCRDKTGMDWYVIGDEKKWGRFVFKFQREQTTYVEKLGKNVTAIRSSWNAVPAWKLADDGGKEYLANNVEIFKGLDKE